MFPTSFGFLAHCVMCREWAARAREATMRAGDQLAAARFADDHAEAVGVIAWLLNMHAAKPGSAADRVRAA